MLRPEKKQKTVQKDHSSRLFGQSPLVREFVGEDDPQGILRPLMDVSLETLSGTKSASPGKS